MDLEDARRVLEEKVYAREREMTDIIELVSDVDLSTLDDKHVRPNMRPSTYRGVWFHRAMTRQTERD
jgi:hypothetical protein